MDPARPTLVCKHPVAIHEHNAISSWRRYAEVMVFCNGNEKSNLTFSKP